MAAGGKKPAWVVEKERGERLRFVRAQKLLGRSEGVDDAATMIRRAAHREPFETPEQLLRSSSDYVLDPSLTWAFSRRDAR